MRGNGKLSQICHSVNKPIYVECSNKFPNLIMKLAELTNGMASKRGLCLYNQQCGVRSPVNSLQINFHHCLEKESEW